MMYGLLKRLCRLPTKQMSWPTRHKPSRSVGCNVVANPLAHLIEQAGDCKEGAPGFMEYLHPYLCMVDGPVSHGARGLQPCHQLDVSSWPGCINRVLRSTLR